MRRKFLIILILAIYLLNGFIVNLSCRSLENIKAKEKVKIKANDKIALKSKFPEIETFDDIVDLLTDVEFEKQKILASQSKIDWVYIFQKLIENKLDQIKFYFYAKMNLFQNMQQNEKNSLLLRNVIDGNVNACKWLLVQGADPDAKCEKGYPLLHYAIMQNELDIVKLLLDEDADVHIYFSNSYQPIHTAALMGHLPILRLLIEHGADVNGNGKIERLSPMYFALLKNNYDIVNALLLDYKVIPKKTDIQTALGNDCKMVQLLLARGVILPLPVYYLYFISVQKILQEEPKNRVSFLQFLNDII